MDLKHLHPKSWLERWKNRPPVVAAVALSGVIAPTAGPGRQTLNLAQLDEVIADAFELKRLKAVALLINSPGGSPVQSALLHDRIRALSKEKDIPIFAFCEDVAASGGYWLACAGDEIYANENSIIGSIGVISASFGFEDLIKKIGVERRVHTSGEEKSFLDPFAPEKPEDLKRLSALQRDIHDAFRRHVEDRRREKLKAGDVDLFNGEFWLGGRAVELGLVDGLGDCQQTMREKFGDKVKVRRMEAKKGWLQRRLNLGDATGAFAEHLLDVIGERLLWRRFGL